MNDENLTGQVEIASTGAASASIGTKDNDEATITRLAALKPMDYDRVRREEAKALGIQIKTLDARVKEVRSANSDVERLPFTDVEPNAEPVIPSVLFDEVSDAICRFIILDKAQADAAALWVAHTYLVDIFDASPILIINAPERACAKTLLQTLLGRMSYRPLPASNASLSALFRAVEVWKPTILIDEADTFFRDNAELHGMVNSGYKRGGYVLRSEASGDNFEPRMFSVYCAKSISGIALEKHLPDSTMSRGIVINLRRKLPHETVERMRHADDSLFDCIASKLARFADDYAKKVRLARPHLPEELSDRSQDNWECLLAIAQCAGQEWLARATQVALTLSSASEQSSSSGNELLSDIREILSTKSQQKICTADLIDALVCDPEMSWATFNRGKPITPRQLAKQLATYDIRPKTVRLGHGNTPKGYEVSQFKDAFDRYLAASKILPQQGNASTEPLSAMVSGVADKGQRDLTRHDFATRDLLPPLYGGGVADDGSTSSE